MLTKFFSSFLRVSSLHCHSMAIAIVVVGVVWRKKGNFQTFWRSFIVRIRILNSITTTASPADQNSFTKLLSKQMSCAIDNVFTVLSSSFLLFFSSDEFLFYFILFCIYRMYRKFEYFWPLFRFRSTMKVKGIHFTGKFSLWAANNRTNEKKIDG